MILYFSQTLTNKLKIQLAWVVLLTSWIWKFDFLVQGLANILCNS